MAITASDILPVFSTEVSAVQDTDKFLMHLASGSTAGEALATQVRAYLTAKIAPSIGSDGYWYLGGVKLVDSGGNGISAKGDTPHLAADTVGVYYYFDSETSGGNIVKHYLINRSEFEIRLDDLTTDQYNALVAAVASKVSEGVIKSSSYANGYLTLTV
jgi:hypothetical protein